MKWLLLIALTFSAVASEFTIVARKGKKQKPIFIKKKLENLISETAFDGQYFKVVLGRSNEPISFDSSEDILLKAATTYYYANNIRNYWVDVIKSEHVINMEKVTIRLDITDPYSEVTHYDIFAAEDEQYFNNALSIPAGETPDFVDEQDKWGPELWFRPKKKILTKEMMQNIGPNPLEQSLVILREEAEDIAWSNFEYKTLNHIFYPTFQDTSYWETVVRHVGTLFVMWGIVKASKYTDPLFLDKYYYMDTALIPEVIYHEYNHLALDDYLANTHEAAIIEGMADYFATAINPQKKMFAPLKKISNNAYKNVNAKEAYTPDSEYKKNADKDLALATLWELKTELKITDVDQFIYAARKHMDSQYTNLIEGLPRALNQTCQELHKNPRLCKRMVFDVLNKKGF
jgi:hypothetical protein